MKVSILSCVFVFFLTGIYATDARAGEYRVWPMLLDIEAEPGNSYPFQFNVLAIKPGNIRVYLNEVEQTSTGHVQFIPTESTSNLTLMQTKANLTQGETYTVKGQVVVPRKATGSRLYAVLVEDDNNRAKDGLQIKVRYAVVVDVTINARKQRLANKLYGLEVVDGTVSAWFENLSDKKANLKSQVIIRDQNRRLVDKQLLRTQSAIERQQDYSIVYPNSKVKIIGLTKKLAPGVYNFLIQSAFDEKSLPVIRSEISYQQ